MAEHTAQGVGTSTKQAEPISEEPENILWEKGLLGNNASEKAIAAVAYLTSDKHLSVGFVLGKAKVAPTHGHTIPRLELCAAVLATEIGQTISDNLDIPLDSIQYHTDSKVVLGYISNEKRRFYTYVKEPNGERFELQNPEEDKEIRPEIPCAKSIASKESLLGTQRFERFSCWKRLVNAIAYVKRFLSAKNNLPEQDCLQTGKEAENLIIKEAQSEMFPEEIECIRLHKKLPKESKIANFDPFIDEYGLMRVGGRLRHAKIPADERHPVIIPGKHHIALLLIRHFHEKIKQGRHFTTGAIRSAGYWIIGEKRLVSSVLQKCVICQKTTGAERASEDSRFARRSNHSWTTVYQCWY
ncbi:uncharacterized protein LOC133199932 [Saccostrea echinata]|uniref:uncharacterized protein LOC133199932 n=1 Tax=Saccostrea echinata TaxID=191078 RepID=UPI002A8112A2|nr:uncharacterized protein LOC133199932 [Saccostrea echinata]